MHPEHVPRLVALIAMLILTLSVLGVWLLVCVAVVGLCRMAGRADAGRYGDGGRLAEAVLEEPVLGAREHSRDARIGTRTRVA